MTKVNRWIAMAGLATVLGCGAGTALAQAPGGGQGGNRGNRGNRPNFDPAQMQQRMMERYKEELEVTDDAEWKVIEPRVQKVMEARMANVGGMGRGMFGRAGRPPGADNAQPPGGQQPPRGGMFGQANPDADALEKAIEGKASNAELKGAIEKFTASRKAKQAELEAAQAELRKVLSVRQEAIATVRGLL